MAERAKTDNAFCPTGPGGGVDPTCGKEGGASAGVQAKKSKAKIAVGGDVRSDAELKTAAEELRQTSKQSYEEFKQIETTKPSDDAPQSEKDAFLTKRADLAAKWSRADRDLAEINRVTEARARTAAVIEKSGLVKDHEDAASIVGAPDDATVAVSGYDYQGGQLALTVSHPKYSAKRTAKIVDGKKVMVNETFFMTYGTGSGLGSQVFSDQAANLSEHGYDRIETWAARGPGMNGYYTWPRLGYDQQISEFRDKRTREKITKAFPQAKSVLDVMATPEGRAWWKANGTNMRKAKFDLKPGSRSQQALAAYLAERKAKSAPTGNAAWSREPENEDDVPPEGDVEEIGDVDEGLTRNDTATQLQKFQKWLKAQFKGVNDQELWAKYAAAGYKKGAAKAYEDVRKKERLAKKSEPASVIGAREEFLRSSFTSPVSVDRIKALAARSFTDMEGVTDAISARMTRTLADGLVEGLHPRAIAKQLAKDIDVSLARATTIARTEIIRAHAEGQLDSMTKMGVTEVGVEVEWLTAGDDRVCAQCADLEGTVLPVDQAHGMLPRHPNCRCAWIPHLPTMAQNFQRLAAAIRLNAFCPTGKGGGIDATCGKTIATAAPKELQKARAIAQAKIKGAPVPDQSKVEKMRAALAKARAGEGRAGGDARGSSTDRKRRAEKLFEEFGGKELGYVVCPHTGLKMHYTDDPALNPKRFPKFEQGKIFTACQGGGYQMHNLIPESFAANRSRNDKRIRGENSKGC